MLKVRRPLPPGIQARYISDTDTVEVNELEVPEDQEHKVLLHLYLHMSGVSTPYVDVPRPELRVLPGGRGEQSQPVDEAS